LADKFTPFLGVAHGRTAAGGRPDRRDHGTDDQAFGADFIGDAFQVVVAGIDIDVGIE